VDFDSLTFSDVSRTFSRRRALNRVSFTVKGGEIVGLLGPNGAGKSTLLSVAATLLHPTSGEVRYGTLTTNTAAAAIRSCIGLLAHDLYVYPELTAAENLHFFARLYRVADAGRAVDGALDRANLAERRNDPVAGFSRGMRQRLAIERALIHAPRLVLLDEPFTGLDDTSAEALKQRLVALRHAGHIVLVTTHDLEAIESIVTRCVVLAGGRLAVMADEGGTLRQRYRRASAAS
jgi:heme ABC exporter ATP-binding subunit CcmA